MVASGPFLGRFRSAVSERQGAIDPLYAMLEESVSHKLPESGLSFHYDSVAAPPVIFRDTPPLSAVLTGIHLGSRLAVRFGIPESPEVLECLGAPSGLGREPSAQDPVASKIAVGIHFAPHMYIALKSALRGLWRPRQEHWASAAHIPFPAPVRRSFRSQDAAIPGSNGQHFCNPLGGILRVHPKCAVQHQGALPIWYRGRLLLPGRRLWAAERGYGEVDESDRPGRYGSVGCLRSFARRE
jgi:hypothetical protein